MYMKIALLKSVC